LEGLGVGFLSLSLSSIVESKFILVGTDKGYLIISSSLVQGTERREERGLDIYELAHVCDV
jgi:hypothetical protein